MNWKEWKEKVDKAVEKKGILPENLNVEFVYYSSMNDKSKVSILKRGKTKAKDGLTHDLFVD